MSRCHQSQTQVSTAARLTLRHSFAPTQAPLPHRPTVGTAHKHKSTALSHQYKFSPAIQTPHSHRSSLGSHRPILCTLLLPLRSRAEKRLCGFVCHPIDSHAVAFPDCTLVWFPEPTSVHHSSANVPPKGLHGRFPSPGRTGYFRRRFSGGSRRDKLLAITPNVDYAAGWTFGVRHMACRIGTHLKTSDANPCIHIVVSCFSSHF